MSKKVFELIPQDVLFFKDARPMEASDAGLGASWPRPDQLYNAIHNTLIKTWPEMQSWEGDKHSFKDRDKHKNSSFRFGALKVVGPFPKKNGKVYFPTPLDLNMRLIKDDKSTNLPSPLSYMFLSRSTDKVSLPKWIDENTYQKYLAGECVDVTKGEELYAADRNIGIAIDSQSGTAIDKKLYQAEYLRLNTGVSMCYEAECVIKPKHRDGLVDVLEREDFPKKLIIGGQGGICNMKESSFDLRSKMLSQNETAPSRFVRWTLLTPLVNVGGWLPGFVNSQTGQVMLKKGNVERQSNESRQAWKERQNKAPSFSEKCKLVAACVGKAIGFSGWDLQKNEPKGTCLAVPAGSIYIFECETEEEARALINVLSYPNRRSDLYGEKGFGIGVCSFYNKF